MKLANDTLRREMFEVFVTERLTEGKLCVWDKITKKKLGTYKTANASTEIKVGDSMVKIKEEQGLLQRFIVIFRRRPELDLKECIETYEFGVVPRSLFASDGSLLLAYDKATILHHLEKLSSITHNRSKLTETRQLKVNHLSVNQCKYHYKWQLQQ